MTPRSRAACLVALLAALAAAAGCSLLNPGPQPRTRFFMLSPTAPAAAPTAAMPAAVIGVGPIRMPDYLDRRTLIVRNGRNELALVELTQWAEPLGDTFARVLADNLSVQLGTRQVALFPWRPAMRIDYQVTVQVAQFDGPLGGPVLLRAHWQVSGGDGKIIGDSGYTQIEEQAGDATIDALVAAQSAAAGRFGREIAAAIGRLAK
jgi:uncharacterized protein